VKRLVAGIVGVLLATVFLVIAAVAVLMLSEPGSRFLVERATRLLPLEVDGVTGSLVGEMRFQRLRYELEGQIVEAQGLEFAFDPMAFLLKDEVRFRYVRAVRLRVETRGGEATSAGLGRFELDAPPITLVIDSLAVQVAEILDLPPSSMTLAGRWGARELSLAQVAVASEVLELRLSGSLANGREPALDLVGSWSLPGTSWSGSGTLSGPLAALNVRHRLEGPVTLEAQGTVDLSNLPDPRFELEVAMPEFSSEGFLLSDVLATVSGGRERVEGVVEGLVSTPWLTEPVPARLSGSADLPPGEVRIAVDGFQAEVLGRPVEGRLVARQLAAGWRLEDVELDLSGSRVSGSAELDESGARASVHISAPDLASLDLGVAGDASGSVDFAAEAGSLSVSVSLSGSELSSGTARLLDYSVSGESRGREMNFVVRGDRAAQAGIEARMPSLQVDGPIDAPAWQLEWQGGAANGIATREGEVLNLRVEALRFVALESSWRLSAPVKASADAAGLRVSAFCIEGPGSSGCVDELEMSGGKLVTAGRLVELPADLVSQWLPLPLVEGAVLEGQWRVVRDDRAWSGSAGLAARRLAYAVAGPGSVPIELPDVTVAAVFDDQVLRYTAEASDTDFELALDGQLSPIAANGALAGTLRLQADDVGPLRAFYQHVRELTGRLEGSVEFGGTLEEPRGAGSISLRDGSLSLERPDLELRELQALLTLTEAGSVEVTGSASQADGRIELRGSGQDLFAAARAFDVELTGSDLAVEHPDWTVRVSPDLRFTYTAGRGHLAGLIELPQAEIKVETLPAGAPRVSDDVVVVGRDEQADTRRTRVTVDVTLVLGDQVALNAAGIAAQLEGRLNARVDAEGRQSLHGALQIEGGAVLTQGQTLTIESGNVVYNGPVDNPYIDLRATRTIDTESPSVTVGVHIRGSADNLTSTIFSDPAMSETRALSYLILGRDIGDPSDTDTSQLAAAAINLGLRSSSSIVADLQRIAGLDELSAVAETQKSFAIVAGKRIGPSLYVRYTYNTLSTIGALIVRYDLTRRWRVEALSSEYSAMDLFYRIGR
jgi:translocation and assembly module TamB